MQLTLGSRPFIAAEMRGTIEDPDLMLWVNDGITGPDDPDVSPEGMARIVTLISAMETFCANFRKNNPDA